MNGLTFITSISHDISYCIGQYICINEIYNLCRKSEFIITEIHCDNEFHKAMDIFAEEQTPKLTVNYCNAHKRVPMAERNNMMTQERFF